MNYKAVLFDLDGTLVDTRAVAHLRRQRAWKRAVGDLNKTLLFPGIADVLGSLRAKGTRLGIVTRSVSFYAAAVCRHHGITVDALVAYHDAAPKPAPDGYLLAMKKLGIGSGSALGVGDDAADLTAMKAAKVNAYGAGWSSELATELDWDLVLATPNDLLAYV